MGNSQVEGLISKDPVSADPRATGGEPGPDPVVPGGAAKGQTLGQEKTEGPRRQTPQMPQTRVEEDRIHAQGLAEMAREGLSKNDLEQLVAKAALEQQPQSGA